MTNLNNTISVKIKKMRVGRGIGSGIPIFLGSLPILSIDIKSSRTGGKGSIIGVIFGV